MPRLKFYCCRSGRFFNGKKKQGGKKARILNGAYRQFAAWPITKTTPMKGGNQRKGSFDYRVLTEPILRSLTRGWEILGRQSGKSSASHYISPKTFCWHSNIHFWPFTFIVALGGNHSSTISVSLETIMAYEFHAHCDIILLDMTGLWSWPRRQRSGTWRHPKVAKVPGQVHRAHPGSRKISIQLEPWLSWMALSSHTREYSRASSASSKGVMPRLFLIDQTIPTWEDWRIWNLTFATTVWDKHETGAGNAREKFDSSSGIPCVQPRHRWSAPLIRPNLLVSSWSSKRRG